MPRPSLNVLAVPVDQQRPVELVGSFGQRSISDDASAGVPVRGETWRDGSWRPRCGEGQLTAEHGGVMVTARVEKHGLIS